LIVLSSAAYFVYYFWYPAEPLWLDVISSVALFLINGFMLVFFAWSNSRIKFDQRESFLYENEFSALTKVEFRRLLKISEWQLEGAGHVYTVSGSMQEDIFYLVSGRAIAELPDGTTAPICEGSVIGEVSFRLGCPASATVTAVDSCMCLRWNQNELRALCNKKINIKLTLDAVLSSHMARKLSDKHDDLEEAVTSPA
jgi:CRP-like cAMP-binding protein